MTHTPHELAEEFPAEADAIHTLKLENAHFAKLCDEYHTINRDIHRAETNVEPTDGLHEQEMRKTRMVLKDQIWGALQAAKTGA
jgi:uncharacterized protein YdcH (DUF465 family)